MAELRIGVLAHRTGRLRELGSPLLFAAELWRARHCRVLRDAGITLVARDSRSEPAGALDAVDRLVREDGVHLVLTLGGTHTVPAVAAACARRGVPSVSSTLPWQVYRSACDSAGPTGRNFHFAWGLDDIGHAFADLWRQVPDTDTVGCLWNAGPQGRALRAPANGFRAAATARGFTLADPGGYHEGQPDFVAPARFFAEHGVRVITSAATAEDLGAFHREVVRLGVRPALVTCSRWLTYPAGARRCGVADVVAPVYWSPNHPYRSSVDGLSCAELAGHYRRATGLPWTQPLGLAYALLEVAVRALAEGADDPAAIAHVLRSTRFGTIVGTIDWTTGPAPGIAVLPLATGQWQRRGADIELVVVANARTPEVPLGGPTRLTGPGAG